jgi:hypothetical protein
LDNLGFEEITISRKENSEDIIRSWNFNEGTEHYVFSAYVTARKPSG